MVGMHGIVDARRQCHLAVQLNTRVARAYIPAREDDSHTSLAWDSHWQSLLGEPFRIDDGPAMRLGLRIADLTLVLLRDGSEPALHGLNGLTLSDAAAWIAGFGVAPDALARPIHFEVDDHPLLHGAAFARQGNEAAFAELAERYSQAADVLEEFRTVEGGSQVRCWPHHFDIATLITVPGGTIGAGMSPGDGSYPEPYYYVSPWPSPEVDRLPRLDRPGAWHTEGWVGAVLEGRSGRDTVQSFVRRAFVALRAMRDSKSADAPNNAQA